MVTCKNLESILCECVWGLLELALRWMAPIIRLGTSALMRWLILEQCIDIYIYIYCIRGSVVFFKVFLLSSSKFLYFSTNSLTIFIASSSSHFEPFSFSLFFSFSISLFLSFTFSFSFSFFSSFSFSISSIFLFSFFSLFSVF